jgi:uncharacterized lipoprotein YddW (UPF0748 family)
MKRRRFLELAGGLAGGALTAPRAPALGVEARSADFSGWSWVHGNSDEPAVWRNRFARLRAAGLRGVLVGGGNTVRLAEAARAEGMAFHAWTWILNRSGDAWVKANHPEWFSVSRKGESSLAKPPYVPYYQWLCPSREPVREYLRGVVGEIAAMPGVDGVHLDYIRHPDVILPRALWAKYGLVQDHEMAEFDFCYCEVCRESFRRESGTDPLRLPDPATSQAWREFRWNSVTGLVTQLSEAARGKGKLISAAVFPTPAIARRLVRQAWEQWPLDLVFPMTYHGFYEEGIPWIAGAVREGVTALGGRAPLYSGLYLPDLSAAQLTQAIAAARAGGAAGVSLFELGGLSDGHLAVLKETLAP